VGGFGITYLAEHLTLSHRVAVKEYLPNEFAVRESDSVYAKSDADREDFAWGLDRFLDEGRTLTHFRHPNLVRVSDCFEANNTAYIVMDYEDGKPLSFLLERHGVLTAKQLKRVLLPIADGLRQVHAAGFLHRDIKPSNIFVRSSDESPVLLDFGASRHAMGQRSRSMTAIASAGYSPPEQYMSDGEQGAWTDIYALSALCYRAMTGSTPVEAPQRQGRVFRGEKDPLPDLAAVVEPGMFPDGMIEAVGRGLRLIEKDRPQDMDEWIAMMDESDTSSSSSVPKSDRAAPPSMPPPQRNGIKRKIVWGLGAASATLAAIFIIVGVMDMETSGPTATETVDAPLGTAAESDRIWGGNAMLSADTEPSGAEVLIGGITVGETPLVVENLQAGSYELTMRHPHYETAYLPVQFADGEVTRIKHALTRAMGRLTILTDPSNAWVELDGARLPEKTPVTVSDLPAGPLELTLGAEDYKPIRIRADVPKDNVTTLRRSLEPLRYGTLTLDLVPPDAEVTLPDIDRAYRPGMRLTQGTYQIAARAWGYAESVREVEVVGNKRVRIELQDFVPEAGDRFRDCEHCPEMVALPTGSFMMGSPPRERGRFGDEGPAHRVVVSDPFAVGIYEVTQGQFRRFSDDVGYSTGIEWVCRISVAESSHPAACVDWSDARAYVEWLSELTGDDYRLLSEAEWEYAARSGTVTARYWGDSESEQCGNGNGADAALRATSAGRRSSAVPCDDGYAQTSPAGSFDANGFGLHDMLGNVWEWTQDCWNESYNSASGDGGAREIGDCTRRVIRGGSWRNGPELLRSASRSGNFTDDQRAFLGFRVARTLTP